MKLRTCKHGQRSKTHPKGHRWSAGLGLVQSYRPQVHTCGVDKEFHRTHPKKCLTFPSRQDISTKTGFLLSLFENSGNLHSYSLMTSIPTDVAVLCYTIFSYPKKELPFLTRNLGKGTEHARMGHLSQAFLLQNPHLDHQDKACRDSFWSAASERWYSLVYSGQAFLRTKLFFTNGRPVIWGY